MHGPRKGKEKEISGVYLRVWTEMSRGFLTVYAVLRTTSDTPTEARTTGQLRDRQLAVVVACLCIGGSCALPLFRSCLFKTCGVLDGLAATAHQNIRSYDVPGIILTGKVIFLFDLVYSRVAARAGPLVCAANNYIQVLRTSTSNNNLD